MLKFIRIAIEDHFEHKYVNSIMEVINATPNPRVAAEILLGMYEEPTIPKQVITEGGTILTLVNYNKFTDKVEYSYILHGVEGKTTDTLENWMKMKEVT